MSFLLPKCGSDGRDGCRLGHIIPSRSPRLGNSIHYGFARLDGVRETFMNFISLSHFYSLSMHTCFCLVVDTSVYFVVGSIDTCPRRCRMTCASTPPPFPLHPPSLFLQAEPDRAFVVFQPDVQANLVQQGRQCGPQCCWCGVRAWWEFEDGPGNDGGRGGGHPPLGKLHDCVFPFGSFLKILICFMLHVQVWVAVRATWVF